MSLGSRAARSAQTRTEVRIAVHALDGPGERSEVVDVREQPVLPVADEFRRLADAR